MPKLSTPYTQAKCFITKRYNPYIVVAENRYQIVINKYGESTLKPLVKRVYAGRIQGQKVENLSNKSDCFYSLSTCSSKKTNIKKLLLLAALLALIALLGVSTAYGNPNSEAYKLYAHMKLGNDVQYRCLVDLWTMESHWNAKADNPKSSAFGIPQLLNMKSTNPYVQIDKGLLYITKRYKLPCKALDRHKKKGNY
jgi:hypothetical protein